MKRVDIREKSYFSIEEWKAEFLPNMVESEKRKAFLTAKLVHQRIHSLNKDKESVVTL